MLSAFAGFGVAAAGYGVGMEAVDYTDTFVTVAPDTATTVSILPAPRLSGPSIASATYELVGTHPYRLRSSQVVFVVWADRQAVPAEERAAARVEFFAKPRVCLRSSELGKRFGGIHANEHGRIALYGVGTAEYRALASGRVPDGRLVKVTAAMRSHR
jgi:hypothetical protein